MAACLKLLSKSPATRCKNYRALLVWVVQGLIQGLFGGLGFHSLPLVFAIVAQGTRSHFGPRVGDSGCYRSAQDLVVGFASLTQAATSALKRTQGEIVMFSLSLL